MIRPLTTHRFRKPNLPTKTCLACGRPYAWRRKWARNWDEVKYCSKRCSGTRRDKGGSAS